MAILLNKNDLYSTGFVIELENAKLLKRGKFNYNNATAGDESHVLKEGEYLWDLAYKFYGDSKLWWIIADTNDIYNPFELEIGVELVIPDFETINAIL